MWGEADTAESRSRGKTPDSAKMESVSGTTHPSLDLFASHLADSQHRSGAAQPLHLSPLVLGAQASQPPDVVIPPHTLSSFDKQLLEKRLMPSSRTPPHSSSPKPPPPSAPEPVQSAQTPGRPTRGVRNWREELDALDAFASRLSVLKTSPPPKRQAESARPSPGGVGAGPRGAGQPLWGAAAAPPRGKSPNKQGSPPQGHRRMSQGGASISSHGVHAQPSPRDGYGLEESLSPGTKRMSQSGEGGSMC